MPNSTNPKAIQILGGTRLSGEVELQGAKNSILHAIVATLLIKKGKTVLKNVPQIQDVFIAIEIAKALGAKVEHDPVAKTIVVDAENLNEHTISRSLSDKMRASVLFVPPLLARLGKARL